MGKALAVEEPAMPDDRLTSVSHTPRIDMLRESDVHFWCRTFDVSPAQLRSAVQQVGPRADAVQRCLQRAPAPGERAH
jgi:hypothetical protein